MNSKIVCSVLLSLLVLCTGCERALTVDEEKENILPVVSTNLSIPRLTIPKNGRIISSGYQLWLRWGAIFGATHYVVQVGTDSQFSSTSFTATVETSYLLTPTLDSGNYYWRVKAVGDDGKESPWSLVQTFLMSSE